MCVDILNCNTRTYLLPQLVISTADATSITEVLTVLHCNSDLTVSIRCLSAAACSSALCCSATASAAIAVNSTRSPVTLSTTSSARLAHSTARRACDARCLCTLVRPARPRHSDCIATAAAAVRSALLLRSSRDEELRDLLCLLCR